MFVDRAPHLVGVEFRCQYRGLAREERHPGGRLGGAVDHRRDRVADHRWIRRGRLGQVVFVFDELSCRKVGSTEQHTIDVLVTPHHTLGETGGAAGVEQIDGVGAAFAEVTLRRPRRDRGIELDAAVAPIVLVRAVLDDQDRPYMGRVGENVGDPVGVAAFVHQRDHVGVVEQVAKFALHVTEVDVHQDGARLHDAQHRDHDLDAVAAVQADLVVLLHALIDQVVREAVGLILQLGVGQLLIAADNGDTVRHGVDGVLGEIGNIQGHGHQTRTCYIS
ncbi:Uncharacterised protein [Mycobacterium tuberculosis]|nr:Uncharacterised protein [Mycobacterium tuberculosis]